VLVCDVVDVRRMSTTASSQGAFNSHVNVSLFTSDRDIILYLHSMYANRRNFRVYCIRKSGSRNTMMTSDFKQEAEIWPHTYGRIAVTFAY